MTKKKSTNPRPANANPEKHTAPADGGRAAPMPPAFAKQAKTVEVAVVPKTEVVAPPKTSLPSILLPDGGASPAPVVAVGGADAKKKKKNNNRKKKTPAQKQAAIQKQEEVNEEEEVHEIICQIEVPLPVDPLEVERTELIQSIQRQLQELPAVTLDKGKDLHSEVYLLKKNLEMMEFAVDRHINDQHKKVRKPDSKGIRSIDLIDQIRVMMANNAEDEELPYFREQLGYALSFENYKRFQGRMNALKKEIANRRDNHVDAVAGARDAMTKQKMLQRLRLLKHADPSGGDIPEDAVMTNQTFELPSEAVPVMFSPMFVVRKLERRFCVVVERSIEKRQRGVTLTGLAEDVKKAITFLQASDFTGKYTVPADNVKSEYRVTEEIEDNFNVLVHYERNPRATVRGVKIFGPPEAAAKAVIAVKAVVSEVDAVNKDAEIRFPNRLPAAHYDAVQNYLLRIHRKIQNVRRSMRVDVRSRSVIIRGSSDKLAEATAEVQAALDEMGTMEFHCTDRGISALGIGERGDAYRPDRPGETRLSKLSSRDFDDLKKNSSLAFYLKENARETVVCVGESDEIEKLQKRIQEMLARAGYTPLEIPLQPVQSNCFRANAETEENHQIALVKAESGARVVLNNDCLEVLGDEEQKAAAERVIQSILRRACHIEEVEIADEEAFRTMMRMKEDIRMHYGVSINTNAETLTFKITGPIDSCQDAAKHIQEKSLVWIWKTIPIANSNHIAILIGKKGETKMAIKTASGVDRLSIDKNSVELVGDAASLALAEKLIEEKTSMKREKPVVPLPAPARATVKKFVHNTEVFPDLREVASKRRGPKRTDGSSTSGGGSPGENATISL